MPYKSVLVWPLKSLGFLIFEKHDLELTIIYIFMLYILKCINVIYSLLLYL